MWFFGRGKKKQLEADLAQEELLLNDVRNLIAHLESDSRSNSKVDRLVEEIKRLTQKIEPTLTSRFTHFIHSKYADVLSLVLDIKNLSAGDTDLLLKLHRIEAKVIMLIRADRNIKHNDGTRRYPDLAREKTEQKVITEVIEVLKNISLVGSSNEYYRNYQAIEKLEEGKGSLNFLAGKPGWDNVYNYSPKWLFNSCCWSFSNALESLRVAREKLHPYENLRDIQEEIQDLIKDLSSAFNTFKRKYSAMKNIDTPRKIKQNLKSVLEFADGAIDLGVHHLKQRLQQVVTNLTKRNVKK